jgi:hypothetical protein
MSQGVYSFEESKPTCKDIKECINKLLRGSRWVKSPFWMAVCGPPQSGKSYLLKRLNAEWSYPQFRVVSHDDEKTNQSEHLKSTMVPPRISSSNAWISTTLDWPERETKGVLIPNYLERISTAILRGAVVGLLSRLYKNPGRLNNLLIFNDDWKQANTPELVLEVFNRRASPKHWRGLNGYNWKMVISVDKFERLISEHTFRQIEDNQFLNTFQEHCEYVRKITDTSLQALNSAFRALARQKPHHKNIGLQFLVSCEGGSFFHTCEVEEGNNCALSRVNANVTCPLLDFNPFGRKFALQESQTSERKLVDWSRYREQGAFCRTHLTRLAKDYQEKYSLTVADAISSACDTCKEKWRIRSKNFAKCVKKAARKLFLQRYLHSTTIFEDFWRRVLNLAVPTRNQIIQIISNIESLQNAGQRIQEFLFKLGLIIRGDGGYRPRYELFLE